MADDGSLWIVSESECHPFRVDTVLLNAHFLRVHDRRTATGTHITKVYATPY